MSDVDDRNMFFEEPRLNIGRVLTWRGKELNEGHVHYPTGTKVVVASFRKTGKHWYIYLKKHCNRCSTTECGGWNKAQFFELWKPPTTKGE